MVKETGFYALLSRMRYISRWGLMRSSIPENVQEHSHETAVYAHALGIIRREIFGQECDAERLAVLAVYHDASEILTGDLPTPIKYHDRTLRDAYKKVEHAADERLLAMLPEELRGAYESAFIGGRGKARQGSRQALGAAPVHRRAQGGQPRISLRRGADAPRH